MSGLAFPKGPTRKAIKRKRRAAQRKSISDVREAVFWRERYLCRCCGFRDAESMHELRPRSLGGKVSRDNSIAVCGDGVRGCHGMLQRHEITYRMDRRRTADGWLAFRTRTDNAAEHTGIWLNTERVSDAAPKPPRRATRAARSPIEVAIDRACGIED